MNSRGIVYWEDLEDARRGIEDFFASSGCFANHDVPRLSADAAVPGNQELIALAATASAFADMLGAIGMLTEAVCQGGSIMLRGSCLCGGVRYQIAGPLTGALNCHCSMCRKAHGAAVRSRARVAAADFRWVQGEELVTYYESSPGNHWGFCRICGSPLLSRFDHDPSSYGLPLGALDDDPGIKPRLHVFVAFKAPWFEIGDELPRFPGLPDRAP